jgi:hypothetical protein
MENSIPHSPYNQNKTQEEQILYYINRIDENLQFNLLEPELFFKI